MAAGQPVLLVLDLGPGLPPGPGVPALHEVAPQSEQQSEKTLVLMLQWEKGSAKTIKWPQIETPLLDSGPCDLAGHGLVLGRQIVR